MSFVGDMFSSGKGAGFQAGGANITEAATKQQADTAWQNTQDAMAAQKSFLEAVQAQGGLQKQTDVYGQLGQVAAGQGPNPAKAMLSQATGANVANQAALMAGQRGASQNVGLMARQAGQVGSQAQQQAAGQAATMQAEQSLGALGQMGGMANTMAGQQGAATTAYNQAAQGQQQAILNAIAQQNQAKVGMQSNINTTNAAIAAQNAKAQQNMLGGLMSGAGMVGGALIGGPAGAMIGGQVGGMVGGGGGGGGNTFNFGGGSAPTTPAPIGPRQANGAFAKGGVVPQKMADGGQVSGPRSSWGQALAGRGMMAQGGPINGEMLAAQGKMVPGKAKVKGDSLKNDNVKALLSPGEIVIPRSIAQSADAPRKAAAFVAAVQKKSSLKKGK